MMTGELRRLDRWASEPGFRRLTVEEAAARLRVLAPNYPGPFDEPVQICVKGGRWFNDEMEAVADAIHRAARRPGRRTETLAGKEWGVDRNGDGLWAVMGTALQ